MQEYKDGLIKKAENLITIGFPEKIVRLNELLETQMFANRNLHDVHQVNRKSIHMEKIVHISNRFMYENFISIRVLLLGPKHSRTRCNHIKSCERL